MWLNRGRIFESLFVILIFFISTTVSASKKEIKAIYIPLAYHYPGIIA